MSLPVRQGTKVVGGGIVVMVLHCYGNLQGNQNETEKTIVNFRHAVCAEVWEMISRKYAYTHYPRNIKGRDDYKERFDFLYKRYLHYFHGA